MNAVFWINGVALPWPKRGLTIEREQLVDSGRNALGQVVSQKINRRLTKINELEWPYLTADQWHDILVEVEKFTGTVTFYDALAGGKITRKVYWGNCTETPFNVDEDGNILDYINCKCNLIDCGFADGE